MVKPGPKPGTMSIEARAKISAAHKGRPKSIQNRARLSESMKANERHIAESSARFRAWNASEQGRKATLKVLKKVHEEWARSDENLAQLAQARQGWLSSPEGARAFGYRGTFARVGKFLRKRDGDLCQLCLQFIDFGLPIRAPMSRSVDHVIPQAAGGTDDLKNLWLSHLICNMKKGARYVGRADGTTDVRTG